MEERNDIRRRANVDKLSEMEVEINPDLLAITYFDKNDNTTGSVECAGNISLCALNASETIDGNLKWCLDSGATSHLCKESRDFVQTTDSELDQLNLASQESTKIVAKGTASFISSIR
ncbi:hypothetical protein Trydic_g5995 [Trypoxylus dichotomus]